MVKRLLTQLEALAFNLQLARLKKIYPNLSGIKIEKGVLWQHPGDNRSKILRQFEKKLVGLDKVL